MMEKRKKKMMWKLFINFLERNNNDFILHQKGKKCCGLALLDS